MLHWFVLFLLNKHVACVRAGLAPCSNNLPAPAEVDSVAADGHGYSTGDGYLKLRPCFPLGF